MPLTLAQNQTVMQFMAAYNAGDVPAMLALFAPAGTVLYAPLGESGFGPAREVGKAIWELVMGSFAPLHGELITSELTEAGEIMCRLRISGTQVQDFGEIPNRGLSFQEDHIFVFRLDPDHRIAHLKTVWNHDSLRRQLGAA
ncbi:MAG: nuclear transport factor 2 family protein [Bacteroidetes bacterium]|nr:MAG: nuclear transport factor 2 family protein [Bacteroidota bacterium]